MGIQDGSEAGGSDEMMRGADAPYEASSGSHNLLSPALGQLGQDEPASG